MLSPLKQPRETDTYVLPKLDWMAISSIPIPVAATLPSGCRVIGSQSQSVTGIEEFRGIPYGIVPGRWQHSVLRTHLPDNPYFAIANGPRCPQPDAPNNTDIYQSHLDFPADVGESEFDCLNLFVTRPSPDALARAGISPDTKLPVFVWIHGGGYAFGASTDPPWDPAQLVQRSLEVGKPFIAVLPNYRLNCFGFLASPEMIAAQPRDASLRGGNFGIGDQYIALEWVSRNIAGFGGDPDRVTVGGQSAGGSSAHAQAINAQLSHSKPLFRRVAIQSGAVGTLGPISLDKAAANVASLAEHLGFGHQTIGEQHKSLLGVSAQGLLDAVGELGWLVFSLVNDGLTIKPCTTGRWAVHLERRQNASTNGTHIDTNGNNGTHSNGTSQKKQYIEVLLSDADAEGVIAWDDATELAQNFGRLLKLFYQHLPPQIVQQGLDLYGINATISQDQLRDAIIQLMTDVEFGLPVQLAREELSSMNSRDSLRPTRTQSYRFKVGNPWPGRFQNLAIHCIDLIYLFDCFHDDMVMADEQALKRVELGQLQLVRRIQQMWIDFITSDNDKLPRSEDKAVIFGRDREVRTVNMYLDKEWVARRARFQFLKTNHAAMDAIARQLMGKSI